MTAMVALCAPRAQAMAETCEASEQGGSGIWRTASPKTCSADMLRFGLSFTYSAISTFAQPPGSYARAAYRPFLVWFPAPSWQLGVAGDFVFAQLVESAGVAHRSVAAAQVFAQYSRPIEPGLNIGGRLDIRVPGAAAANEAGHAKTILTLVPGASTIVPQVLFGVPIAKFDTALALGYAFDFSSHLLAQAANDEQATSMLVASDNHMVLKVGTQRTFLLPHHVLLTPFGEICAAFGVQDTAATLTLGGKAEFGEQRVAATTLGVDVGLSNFAPNLKSLPPTPPWQLLVQGSVALDRAWTWASTLGDEEASARRCSADSQCVAPQRCHSGLCQLVYTAGSKPKTYKVLRGQVVDVVSGDQVHSASVRVDTHASIITTDANGSFATWPLDTEQKIYTLVVSAPGYATNQVDVNLGTLDESSPLRIPLSPQQGLSLYLQGSVRSELTQKGIVAHIHVEESSIDTDSDAQGEYHITLLPGAYQLRITAPGYVSQKQLILGDIGGVVSVKTFMKPLRH